MRRPGHAGARAGGALLLVLPLLALLLTLVLSSATQVRLRWVAANDVLRRATARDAARSQVADALHALLADTNGVDALDEPWARTRDMPLTDEEARINLLRASPALLATLFQRAAGLPSAQAREIARGVAEWRPRQRPTPAALELFAFAPGMDTARLARLAPYATVHGEGRVNLNTTSEEVLRCLLLATGTAADVAERMLSAWRRHRRAGHVCADVTPEELAAVFVGPRRIPDAATALALAALAPLLDVRSNFFRGVAVGVPDDSDHPRHTIAFVFHRPTRTFVRWVE